MNDDQLSSGHCNSCHQLLIDGIFDREDLCCLELHQGEDSE